MSEKTVSEWLDVRGLLTDALAARIADLEASGQHLAIHSDGGTLGILAEPPPRNPFLSPDPPHITTGTYDVNECRAAVVQLKTEHRDTLDRFEQLWYHGPYTWATTQYRGHCLMKFPTDLWAYQELVYHLQPDLIIETGTAFGASALYFAHLLDHNGKGNVISIDIAPPPHGGPLPQHARLTYLRGDSVDPAIVAACRAVADRCERVMVVLDSDHDANHVWMELEAYHGMVTSDSYLVVEDTNCDRPHVWNNPFTPWLALRTWLPQHPEYQPDVYWERWLVTSNPFGWLHKA